VSHVPTHRSTRCRSSVGGDVLLIPSSVNAFRAEHRQLPGVGSLIVADEIRVAVRASEFEVPVVGRQPRVEHFRDGDVTISKNLRAGLRMSRELLRRLRRCANGLRSCRIAGTSEGPRLELVQVLTPCPPGRSGRRRRLDVHDPS
jgi:hypothetical protein